MGNFKHWLAILCSFTLLTACSEATSVEPTDPAEKELNVEAGEELTVEDILQKSIKAMENVKSLSIDMNMIQEMVLPDEESYSTTSSIYMEITQKPLNMYKKVIMKIPELGDMTTEFYMVKDSFFYKDPIEDKWFTYPDEIAEQLREMEDSQMAVDEQLKLLLKNAETITYEVDNEYYIISVEGSPGHLQSFAQELNGLVHDNMAGDIDQLMLMSEITELHYTLYIDKVTFLQSKVDLSMAFSLLTDGESLTIKTSTQASFANYNDFTNIEVPAQVVEAAEEFAPDYSGIEGFDETDWDEFDFVDEDEENTEE